MSTENEESLYRPYNFNSRTAFRTGTVVPPFGVYRNDEFGSHKIIRDAVFLRLEKDEFNPINAYVYLKIPFSNGGVKEFRMSESDYLEIIENVREFEDRKAKCSTDSFEWKKCHMDYAEKMKIDDDLFRLNTALNFFHNFSVQCRHNCLSRADQVMQVAELMINDMSKYEKKAMIDMQKAFTKKEKNKKAFEQYLVKIFEKNKGVLDKDNDEILNITSIKLNDLKMSDNSAGTANVSPNFSISGSSENNAHFEGQNARNGGEKMENTIQRWEYKLVRVYADGDMKANYLGQILPKESNIDKPMTEADWNILGNLGWEVVTSYGVDSRFVLLKRPKIN